MNDGTWAFYTIAVVMLGLGMLFVAGTIWMKTVVAARRHGLSAGLMLGAGASALVYATIGKGVDDLATWQHVLLVAAMAAVVAGFGLVGIAWAEDVAADAPNKHVRMLLGIALPLTAAGVGLVAYWATRADLPVRLASHYSNNQPDDSATVAQFAAITSMVSGVGVVALVAISAIRRPLKAQMAPSLGFLGGFISAMGVGIFAFTLLSHRGLADWRNASAMLPLVGAGILGVLLGVPGGRFASMLPTLIKDVPDASQRPTMSLRSTEHAVWSTTLHSRLLQVGGLIIVLMTVFISLAQGWSWWAIPLMSVSAVMAFSLSRLRVRADGSGLHVHYGFLPWPSTHVSVDQIDSASVIDVRPMEWGGWGYRGSLTLMRQAAVVLRAGPGIRLDLDNGKVFVVTVDDPETPVALLNAEVSRA